MRNFLKGDIDFRKVNCYNFYDKKRAKGLCRMAEPCLDFTGNYFCEIKNAPRDLHAAEGNFVAEASGRRQRSPQASFFLYRGKCKEENENVLC